MKNVSYYEASGDIVGSFVSWEASELYGGESSITFSSQIFDVARSLGCRLWAHSFSGRRRKFSSGSFKISSDSSFLKLPYRLRLFLQSIKIVFDSYLNRADYLIVSSGCSFFAALFFARPQSKIILVYHNNLVFSRNVFVKFWEINSFRIFCKLRSPSILAVSERVRNNLATVYGIDSRDVGVFFPLYAPSEYLADNKIVPKLAVDVFRFLFVGRLEYDKGVSDLISALGLLNDLGYSFELSICGDGSAQHSLMSLVEGLGLGDRVRFQGRLNRSDLMQQYAWADVVVVPTRNSFPEGFAMVAAEASLMRKPLICSSNVPAVDCMPGASLVFDADSVDSLKKALILAMDDRDICGRMVIASCQHRDQFFDRSRSLGFFLRSILD